jgi:hypothetical protein
VYIKQDYAAQETNKKVGKKVKNSEIWYKKIHPPTFDEGGEKKEVVEEDNVK